MEYTADHPARRALARAAGTALLMAIAGIASAQPGDRDDLRAQQPKTMQVAALVKSLSEFEVFEATGRLDIRLLQRLSKPKAAAFPLTGAKAQRRGMTIQFSAPGTKPLPPTTVYRYTDEAGQLLGASTLVDGKETQCWQVTEVSPLPQTAAVGSTGPVDKNELRASCQLSAPPVATGNTIWFSRHFHDGLFFCVGTITTSDKQGDGASTMCRELVGPATLGKRAKRIVVDATGEDRVFNGTVR